MDDFTQEMNGFLLRSKERGEAELAALQPVPLTDIPSLSQTSNRVSAEVAPFAPRRMPETRRLHPFEVFIFGFTSSSADTARVKIGTGTILEDESDITSIATIDGIDNALEVTLGDWIWIEVQFDADGGIVTALIGAGGTWPAYPSLFDDSAGDGSNIWYQPLAQLRGPLTDKIGEHPIVEDAVISQKTNTHLVACKACIGDSVIWTLAPGVGGDDAP